MKKMRYQQLTDFLLSQLPEKYRKHFYSWMENGKLLNDGKQVTATGIEIAQIEYQAIFYFDQLPFKEINPYKLLALVQIWLNENDDWQYRDFQTPFNIEMIDDSTAELDITITFSEPITAEQDDLGDLMIDGECYRFDEVAVHTAQAIDVAVRIDSE